LLAAPRFDYTTAVSGSQHDNPRADLDPLIEIDGIGVHHPDAAGGHRLADRVRLVGAVDAKQRVLVALEQIKRAGAERIFEPAVAATILGRLCTRPCLGATIA
jgi:hypothetical protein